MKVARVLVPLDGRRASECALPAAIDLVRAADGRLYVIRVIEPPGPDASLPHRRAVERAEEYLGDVTARVTSLGGIEITTAVWAGAPAAAIVKAAEVNQVDVIVMVTDGETGPPRRIGGSVAERVIRGTRRKVLVIRTDDAVTEPPDGDAAPLPAYPDAAERADRRSENLASPP